MYAWIGFFYLVNLNISFSIWFFYLLNKAQEGIFASLGIASSEKLSLYSYSQTADLTHEVMGGLSDFCRLYFVDGAATLRGGVAQGVARRPNGG